MSIRCPYCLQHSPSSESRALIVSFGYFKRNCDQQRFQRFKCKPCNKTFSTASFHACYKQKKRHLNANIFLGYASGKTERRMARVFKVNRKTVSRKLLFLGINAHHFNQEDQKNYPLATEVEFDDLETMEHSKLKPVSVTMAVETDTRRILGFRVAQMPAKGLLVERALKKYGPRKDERKAKRRELFRELQPHIARGAIIKSDENPHYRSDVREFFPNSDHKIYKGRRGCVVGQGELKAGGFDPLFSLNHSFAMLRANISRLFRRTWNTTKKRERLALHIAIYVLYHNLELIRNPSR